MQMQPDGATKIVERLAPSRKRRRGGTGGRKGFSSSKQTWCATGGGGERKELVFPEFVVGRITPEGAASPGRCGLPPGVYPRSVFRTRKKPSSSRSGRGGVEKNPAKILWKKRGRDLAGPCPWYQTTHRPCPTPPRGGRPPSAVGAPPAAIPGCEPRLCVPTGCSPIPQEGPEPEPPPHDQAMSPSKRNKLDKARGSQASRFLGPVGEVDRTSDESLAAAVSISGWTPPMPRRPLTGATNIPEPGRCCSCGCNVRPLALDRGSGGLPPTSRRRNGLKGDLGYLDVSNKYKSPGAYFVCSDAASAGATGAPPGKNFVNGPAATETTAPPHRLAHRFGVTPSFRPAPRAQSIHARSPFECSNSDSMSRPPAGPGRSWAIHGSPTPGLDAWPGRRGRLPSLAAAAPAVSRQREDDPPVPVAFVAVRPRPAQGSTWRSFGVPGKPLARRTIRRSSASRATLHGGHHGAACFVVRGVIPLAAHPWQTDNLRPRRPMFIVRRRTSTGRRYLGYKLNDGELQTEKHVHPISHTPPLIIRGVLVDPPSFRVDRCARSPLSLERFIALSIRAQPPPPLFLFVPFADVQHPPLGSPSPWPSG